MIGRKAPSSPDSALAGDIFDQLCAAGTMKSILHHHRHLCEVLRMKPTNLPHFYPKLRSKINNWRAQALWNKFDKRASCKCYNRGKACSQTKVLIIGAGPCGLRAAIEAQLLGARVVVVEKRDRISRNNVLHLWPFVIHDLKGLGAKKFFGKFCAGAIDHISIRQLQVILLKVALILGVEIHEGVSFEKLLPPPADQHEKTGWRAVVTPSDHPVSQFEFDVLIGADGKRNTLEGFTRKEFRGKLAIAITANFINRRTEAEARVEEISGVAFIFNQKFFKDLYSDTRIDLENIVYYKDDTHYFVMTAKKHSLIDKGVILHDYADTARLLDPINVDKEALLKYAKEAADFSTNYMLPDLDFAVNHYGQPDVAMFDFTSMYAAENASRVVERNGHKLLQLLVGDSLLEPFWPTGSGCARGFLSSIDACWAIRSWATDGTLSPLEVLAERESIYRLLGQTTPENLQKDLMAYTVDPASRYPNLNTRSVLPYQVKNLFETDDPVSMELALVPTAADTTKKKRRWRDSQVHPDTLVQWLKRQVCLHADLHVTDVTYSFRSGLVLCAIIGRYRPDLLDFDTLDQDDIVGNNQRAFDILEKEYGILPVMTGDEMSTSACPDRLTMLSYLSQLYDAFRGEIPHTKHPRLLADLEEDAVPPRPAGGGGVRKRASPQQREGATSTRRNRKRRSDKSFGGEERQQRIEEIEENRRDRMRRLKMAREIQTGQLMKSLAMLQANHQAEDGEEEEAEGFNDYSLYVYRQTADEFTNRVKDLEMKLRYPDRESRLRAELRSRRAAGETDEDFTARIKELEEKLRGNLAPTQKKPHDLLRAIGKIEKTDWQIQEIEKKIRENQWGTAIHETPEKVPKWSRQQFNDKFEAVERKLLKKGLDADTATKYAEVDVSLKRLEHKLKEGSTLDAGQRGSNKVSAMAEQFAPKPDDKIPLAKSSSKGALVLPTPSASDMCHFCDKRVYLMERVNAEGRFFHRSCFKCEYCFTTLRVGSYMYDGEGRYGYRFYCNQHFRMPGTIKQRTQTDRKPLPSRPSPKTPTNKNLSPAVCELDRGATPERIEFENEGAQHADSEMDEDEWTDRNFGPSAAEASSDDVLDMSSSSDDGEEVEEALMTADETREVAERWTKRHSQRVNGMGEEDDDSCEADDSDDVDDYSEDDESDTATDGEEDLRALELRKQEVRVQPARTVADTDTGSDTEVASSRTSSDEVENSATEISTDSEFEHDGATPTRPEIPDILTAHRRKRPTDEPKKVQVKSGLIGKGKEGVKLDIRPLVETNNFVNAVLSRPTPLQNPKRGDYLLSKTQSTEGIATKMSLELRKKYLLGAPASSHAVTKSATATALDSKLRNFASSITECQKLLNPAAEISPSMQAFLQTTNKPRSATSPTLPEPVVVSKEGSLLRKQKELPSLSSSFVHVCGKNVENRENDDPNVVDDVKNKNFQGVEKDEKEDSADCRPRSPAHETSILVPQIPWAKPDVAAHSDESESESGSETESESDQVEVEEHKPPPPRLEVRDSQGELVDDEVFEMDSLQPGTENPSSTFISTNEGHTAMSMAAQIELARSKIDEIKNSIARGQSALNGAFNRPPSAELTSLDSLATVQTTCDDIQPDSIIDVGGQQGELALDSIEPLHEPFDSIEHISEVVRQDSSDSDSCQTYPAETELSDWARDGDLFDEDGTKSKHAQKPKSLKINAGLAHVCGRLLASAENIDFMDTDPSVSESSISHVNRGYVLLVDPDVITPTAAKDSSSSSTTTSSSGHPPIPNTTEESTTSEPTTVKNIDENERTRDAAYYWPLEDMSPITPGNSEKNINDEISVKSLQGRESPFHKAQNSIKKSADDKNEFNDYVHRLQGRISPFHNARDSIDYRKSKQKAESPVDLPKVIKEEEEKIPEVAKDTTSKKLQELSRERTMQKDLVHEMVMKKVLAGKKSPGERKNRRGFKGSPAVDSPTTPTPQVPETLDNGLVLSLASKPPLTPGSSKKIVRPVSVHLGTSSLKGASSLPDTPLTNPDLFNVPSQEFEFKTPLAPPREKRAETTRESAERDKIRESARARARLKSDEELGLSPEERLQAMKDKVNKMLDTPKRSSDDLPKRSSVKTTLKVGGRVLKSSSTSTMFDKLRGVGDKMASSTQKSTSDLVHACRNDGQLSPELTPQSLSKTGELRSRDRERRKSIIQAVSDFFHKKSTSPSKSPSPKSSSPTKAMKSPSKPLPATKSKDKKDLSEAGSIQVPSSPPPVPPPPSSYLPQALISEESGSELEGASMSTPSHVTSADPAAQRARMTKRMARQAQLKRLRMAQEIQRRLEEVEEKQREMETRGVELEKSLRQEGAETPCETETHLLRDWFELVRERNELRRYERELIVRAKEIELEDRHARLQQELRERLSKDDSMKSQEEVAQEGVILREMLETVEKRDALTKILEEERQRYQDEEKDLESQVLAKGLRLTPIRKYEYQTTV